MRTLYWFSVLVGLFLAGSADALDLTTIDRSLRKEPTYQSKEPLYCLLVFGPKAEVRVWVVLDGDVLYLDRNGNGDLTEAGERIEAREVLKRPEIRPDVEVMRTFDLSCWKEGEEPILTCGPVFHGFTVSQLVPREDWHDRDWVAYFQEKPFTVYITSKTAPAQRAELRFAARRQDAPIVPFDGPRRFVLSEKFGQHLFRPGEPCKLAVELHAEGVNATVCTEMLDFPENVHPVAQIEFPPQKAGGDPIRKRVVLKSRC